MVKIRPPVAHDAETKHRHWVEPAMVCQASDAMIQRHGERISSLPSAAASDVTENCQDAPTQIGGQSGS